MPVVKMIYNINEVIKDIPGSFIERLLQMFADDFSSNDRNELKTFMNPKITNLKGSIFNSEFCSRFQDGKDENVREKIKIHK